MGYRALLFPSWNIESNFRYEKRESIRNALWRGVQKFVYYDWRLFRVTHGTCDLKSLTKQEARECWYYQKPQNKKDFC